MLSVPVAAACLITDATGKLVQTRWVVIFSERDRAMYKIADAGDGRKYFAQIPNIIDSMNLSVYAFRLYVHLKRVAGESGYCNESLLTMQNKLNISQNTVIAARRELEEPRDELGGKSLITSETKPNTTDGKGYTLITINDIWPENVRFCEKMNGSPNDALRVITRRVRPHQVTRYASPDDVKEEQDKEQITNTRESSQDKKEEEEVRTPDDVKEEVALSLQRGLARNGGRTDIGNFPADVAEVIQVFCDDWHFTPPRGKSQKSKWIQDGRDLLDACGEFGLDALRGYRKEFESYMDKHGGIAQHTVCAPGSLVNMVRAHAAKMREVSQTNKPKREINVPGDVWKGGKHYFDGVLIE